MKGKMEKKDRLAFVVHRYGDGINGGAEDHCRLLAQHLKDIYKVSILTSCTRGMNPLDNYYKQGKSTRDGIDIIRFRVENMDEYSISPDERLDPFCPGLKEYLLINHDIFKAIIFITYNQYLSYIGLSQNFDNAILLPTAHNERSLKNIIYRKVFQNAKGFLFNSVEEYQLLNEYFEINETPFRTPCFGLELSDYNIEGNASKNEQYILYVGRVSKSKNFEEINDFFLHFKKRNPSDLKLVVLGRIDNDMPIIHHEDIILKGFVSEYEKKEWIKNSFLLVLPSKKESLSIVLLESFACKRPVLVNGLCDVLKGQCERSNGGLYYTNFYEFEAELNYLIKHRSVRKRMGDNGYEYVKRNYSWNKVTNNVISLIHQIYGEEQQQNDWSGHEIIKDGEIDIKVIIEKCKGSMKEDEPITPKEKFINCLVKVIVNYKQVVIVGAGLYGELLYLLLAKRGIETVTCFADNSFEKYQQCVEGKAVVSIETAVDLYPNAYFVITPKYHLIDLWNQLKNLNVRSEQIGYYVN